MKVVRNYRQKWKMGGGLLLSGLKERSRLGIRRQEPEFTVIEFKLWEFERLAKGA